MTTPTVLDGFVAGVITFKIAPATTRNADHVLYGFGTGPISFGTPAELKGKVAGLLNGSADLKVSWVTAGERLGA